MKDDSVHLLRTYPYNLSSLASHRKLKFMTDILKVLLKQRSQVILLILGTLLVMSPCVTIDKDYHWTTHPPNTWWLAGIGSVFLIVDFLLIFRMSLKKDASGGLDLSRVKESKGVLWTIVNGCEICVLDGKIQDFSDENTAVVLPCNEYFDDRCVGDTNSALGAYVNHAFDGRVDEFISLLRSECRKKLGTGTPQNKTYDEQAESFGAGKCVLLLKPLNRSLSIAVVSTTTQRANTGLSARISYQFDGMRELVAKLADARINEIAMPILGAGHGRIDPPLAFVGLLLAVAEAARYGQGGQRLRKVTIVVFKRDDKTPPEVDRLIVRRALALIGSNK